MRHQHAAPTLRQRQEKRPRNAERGMTTRCAFWSGNLKARDVCSIFAHPEKHIKMAKALLAAMPVSAILQGMGEKGFIAKWPNIRTLIFDANEREDSRRLCLLDAAWSVLVVGDSQYPVTDKTARLSKCRKDLLKVIAESPGVSIYQLAKQTQRQYSRVHKDVALLVKEGILEAVKNRSEGRQISNVSAVESTNTKLAKAIAQKKEAALKVSGGAI